MDRPPLGYGVSPGQVSDGPGVRSLVLQSPDRIGCGRMEGSAMTFLPEREEWQGDLSRDSRFCWCVSVSGVWRSRSGQHWEAPRSVKLLGAPMRWGGRTPRRGALAAYRQQERWVVCPTTRTLLIVSRAVTGVTTACPDGVQSQEDRS